MPQPLMPKKLKLNGSVNTYKTFYHTKKKKKSFHQRGLSRDTWSILPGVIGKFVLGVQNEAGQRVTELGQEYTLVIANTIFQQHKR